MSDIDTIAIREAFETNRKRTLNLSDELLTTIVQRAGKRWDAFENADDPEEAACEFLEQAEQTAQQVMVSDPGISVLIQKMDMEFHKAVKDDIEAVVVSKNSAIHIYSHFRRIYSLDELNSMPIPGTELEHVTGNQRPDKTKTKDNTGKPITVVWSNDFVSAMPEGREYEGILDEVAKEVKAPGSVPRLKGKSKQQLASIKSDANQRRNALRSMVKRAVSLHHQWEAIRSMEKIGINWIAGTKEKYSAYIPEGYGEGDNGDKPTIVTVAPRSIWLFPKDDPANGRDFSVTQLLAFDVPAAIAKGGTMADLVETAGRGAVDASDDDNGDGEDMPEDVAMATFSQLVNYLNKRENMANVLRIMTDKKHPEHNDWLENMGDLYSLLFPIMRKTRSQYEALKETKLEGFETKAA